MKKKALRETQILHAGCSKVEPKIFAPPQTPSKGRRTAKISSAGDGRYLYLQTQFGEDWWTQFRVIVVTDPQTHKQTNPQTGPITIHCATKLSVQCNELALSMSKNTMVRWTSDVKASIAQRGLDSKMMWRNKPRQYGCVLRTDDNKWVKKCMRYERQLLELGRS